MHQLKLFVFGGPYGHLHATRTVLDIAKQKGYHSKEIVCTGDVIAYCAQGSKTIDLIRSSNIHVVQGNVDEQIGNDKDDCNCNFQTGSTCSVLSQEWYGALQQEITPDKRKWLAALPKKIMFTIGKKKVCIVHGSYTSINEYVFESTPWDLKEQELRQSQADIIIGGHCGIPFIQTCNDNIWANAGVVGMPPNDGTTDGWYLEVTPDTIETHRFTVDQTHQVQAIKNRGVALAYAKTLQTGLWPSMDVLPQKEQENQGKRLQEQSIKLGLSVLDQSEIPD